MEGKKIEDSLHMFTRRFMKDIAPCKEIQDSLGFCIPRCGFRILCQWSFDSEFQLTAGFRIPKPRICDSRILIILHVAKDS